MLDLCGSWIMKRVDSSEWIPAEVPGSMMNDLLSAKKISDPFYRDNEDEALELASYDYEYCKEFLVDKDLLSHDKVILVCEGLDTITEIRMNGYLFARTDNMHRKYEFDMKGLLKEGTNNLSITFLSSLNYVRNKHREDPIWPETDSIGGFSHLRKGHYMFGWDWGPRIPDLGIWRNIYIKGYNSARIEEVFVTQVHDDGKVNLDICIKNENWSQDSLDIDVSITSPEGKNITQSLATSLKEEHVSLQIDDPKLWWPNGYGEHPLYKVEVKMKKDSVIIDSRAFNIGLRTITVKREKDKWGESFEFVINGISIFAMGANYIPEDNLLSRRSLEKTERLIKDSIAANFNCIRVWGGGLYPEDYFYDLCDEYGLIVWQDHMFACAAYRMNKNFSENIKHEVQDNVKRLRHHACIGLWCGNNEIEVAWTDWNFFEKSASLKTDYIKQFEILLPEVTKKTDPNTFYWPSSPSSGGGFDNPGDENRGDVHYWDVWHGLKPFTDYRNYHFRFVSEFGFQSFPSMKTVESFTLPEDRNIFSYVMEKHQKNGTANGKILFYLSDTYKYPKDFESLLYVSQLLQAEAIRYGVEHWRRNRGRCMGSIYWQLNDCWPVASWASIDYYGRWKALHYYAKKFYAPVLLSACEEGTKVELYTTNDSLEQVKGNIVWKLKDNTGKLLKEGTTEVEVAPLTAALCISLDFSDILSDKYAKHKVYLEFSLVSGHDTISSGTVLFAKSKHFEFVNPQIESEVKELEDRFVITFKAKAYAKSVEIDLHDADGVFSDNYFDLSVDNDKQIEILKSGMSKVMTLDEFKASLRLRSLFDTI